MEPKYDKIHLKFKLNNFNFGHDELKEVAYSLVKEGLPYEQVIGDFLLDWLDDKDYLEVKTSGSTGVPKIIRIKKQVMVHSAITTGDFFHFEPGDKALHSLPTQFIAGKMMLVRAMILGLELDMVEPSSHPVFDYETPYNFGAMIPSQLHNVIKYVKNIETIIIGGAKASWELINDIQNCGANVYETFGMTETVSHIAIKKLNNFKKGQQFESSHFKTMSGISVSLDDRGCLVIDAPHLSENKIITNDLVNIFSKNEFDWIGRYDNVINSGGVKLNPERIEKKLDQVLAQRFIIGAQDDAVLGEKLILVIEGKQTELDASIYHSLDKYETPKQVYFIDNFVETATGKIQRAETLKLLEISA